MANRAPHLLEVQELPIRQRLLPTEVRQGPQVVQQVREAPELEARQARLKQVLLK